MAGKLVTAHGRALGLRERGPHLLTALLPALVLGAAFANVWWLAVLLAGAGVVAQMIQWDLASVPECASVVGFGGMPVEASGEGSGTPSAAEALARAQQAGHDPVCIRLRLVDPANGTAPEDAVIADRAARLGRVLRAGDVMERQGTAEFVIVLAPGAAPDVEDLVQIAARIQGTATAPGVGVGGNSGASRLSAVMGLCRGRDITAPEGRGRTAGPAPTADAILAAATVALADAQAQGAGSIRVYSARIGRRQARRAALAEDVAQALDNGTFEAWFQPQVCTDTGRTSGFEALARWHHPQHGMVPPTDFLPALEAAGLLERLGMTMLEQAMEALVVWDREGLDVPSVGVNMSAADLRDPHLARRIAWMLDRHDLSGNRLTVEVLESVVADGGSDPTASPLLRNIAALADMGCGIDLDDFGTGHASITSLHRLAVSRVKIDRSFVTGLDHDRDRQKMIMTILSMCDHLGLQTLAEGVETPAEHAILAQLGCHHVQGFGIGLPMRRADCSAWLRDRRATLDEALRPIRRHT